MWTVTFFLHDQLDDLWICQNMQHCAVLKYCKACSCLGRKCFCFVVINGVLCEDTSVSFMPSCFRRLQSPRVAHSLGYNPEISEKSRTHCILGKGRLEAVAILFDPADSLEQKTTKIPIKRAYIKQLHR